MAFTYFFRDVQTLEMIRDIALPYLRGAQRIRIWDAGCAMGPEPYTLAIILRESMGYMLFRNLEITATDIDGSNLFGEIIREGVYPRDQVERIPGELLEKHFEKLPDKDAYRISEEMRKAVKFQQHDLLTMAPPGKGFGVIVCKNVLLHFQQEDRIRVIKMYHDCLLDGGYLAMEQTQKLPDELSDYFELAVPNAQLYRKRVVA